MENTTFTAHKQLLCDSSPLFERLYTEHASKRPTDEPLELKNAEPAIFQEVLTWVYRGNITVLDVHSTQSKEFLVKLWLLAESLEMPNLQNQTFFVLNNKVDGVSHYALGKEVICQIYRGTGKSSPLRLYTVDTWLLTARASDLESCHDKLPREFIVELCTAFLDRGSISIGLNVLGFTGVKKRYFVSPKPKDDKTNVLKRERLDELQPPTATGSQMQNKPALTPHAPSPVEQPSSTSALGKVRQYQTGVGAQGDKSLASKKRKK